MPQPHDPREQIVTAARRAFYTKGYEQTSLADLAKASGIPKGNFYYHFRSKEDVLLAVIEFRTERIQAHLKQWRADIPEPRARLQRFVEMLTNDSQDLVAYGCPMGSLLTELGKHREDPQRDASAMFGLFIAFAKEQFRLLGITPKKADELATRLMARCQGALIVGHAFRDSKVLAREVRDIEAWLISLAQ